MLPSTYNASSMLRPDYGPLERIGALDSSVFRGKGNDGGFVALRFLRTDDPTIRDAMGQIAHTASGIRHPMLAAVGGCQRCAGDALCIVTEYVPGQPLDRWVRDHGLPPLRMTVDFVRRLCLGLHAAHQRDLTHGALHPGNLIVLQPDTRPGGRIVAKLLDTGVPSWLRIWPPRLAAAQFVAPELLRTTTRPNAPAVVGNATTDVYACGALLYYLCTGGPPLQCGSLSQLIALASAARAIQRPSYINPEIPAELEDVMLRAVAIDPTQRLANASELAILLADVEALWSDSGVRRRDMLEPRKRRLTSPDAVTPVVNMRGVRGTPASQSSARLDASTGLPRGVVRSHTPIAHPSSPKPVTPRAHVAPSGTYPKLEWPKRRSSAGLALVALSTLLAAYAAYLATISGNANDGRLKRIPPAIVAQRHAVQPSGVVPSESAAAADPRSSAALATGAHARARPTTFVSEEVEARALGRTERARVAGATRSMRISTRRARALEAQELSGTVAKDAAQLQAAKVAERELLIEAQPAAVEAALATKRPLATPPSFAQSAPEPTAVLPASVSPVPANDTASPAVGSTAANAQRTSRALQIGDVRVKGSLSPSVVRRAIERIRPLLRRCVQQHASRNGDARAGVVVSTTIDEIGRASAPSAHGGASPALNDCLVAAAGRLVADKPDTGTVKVSWKVEY
jgi:serine/threonine protein kinase